jgi:hypothetical protein
MLQFSQKLLLLIAISLPLTLCDIFGDNNYGEVYEYYDQSEEVITAR